MDTADLIDFYTHTPKHKAITKSCQAGYGRLLQPFPNLGRSNVLAPQRSRTALQQ